MPEKYVQKDQIVKEIDHIKNAHNMNKPKIEEIRIVHQIDINQDFSTLETEYEKLPQGKLKILKSLQIGQEFADMHPRLAMRYIRENTERLNQVELGNIWKIWVYAQAVVKVDKGSFSRLDTLQSGGLGGVDSDFDDSFFKEVDTEQLADLKSHLEDFNVDISNFDALANKAILKRGKMICPDM